MQKGIGRMARRIRGTTRPGTDADGFTLVEIMIAIAIFSIGILGVFAMIISSINGNAAARLQTEATALAVEQMERLISQPMGHADLTDGTRSVSEGAFNISWTVTDNAPINGSKTIAVTVTNQNPNAKPVSLSFVRQQ